MDEQHELERLQEQCRRFSCYHALLREDNGDPYQRTLQCLQNMALVLLLASIQKDVFDLLQDPQEVEEIGTDILGLLRQFSKEYADLLELEYQWCENDLPGI